MKIINCPGCKKTYNIFRERGLASMTQHLKWNHPKIYKIIMLYREKLIERMENSFSAIKGIRMSKYQVRKMVKHI